MSSAKRRLRVTIDTNVFVSSFIAGEGPTHEILEQWYDVKFILVMSEDQRDELIDVLRRPQLVRLFQLDAQEQQAFLNAIRAVPAVPSASSPVAVRDPKDEMILGAATVGKADFLVTGDEDLLVLHDERAIQPLQIVTPRAFIEVLHNREI